MLAFGWLFVNKINGSGDSENGDAMLDIVKDVAILGTLGEREIIGILERELSQRSKPFILLQFDEMKSQILLRTLML